MNNSWWDGKVDPGTAFATATDAVTGVLAITGNLFSFFVIRATPDTDVQEGTRVFIQALTFTDLLIGVTYVISLIIRVTEENLAGIFICKGNSVVQFALFIESITTLVIIGVDRCLAIVRPLRYPMLMNKKRAIVTTLVASALTMAFALTFIGLYGVVYLDYVGCYPNISIDCIVGAILQAFTIILPNAILVGIYAQLMKVSHRHAMRIRQLPAPTGNSREDNQQPQPKRLKPFAGWKALRMLLLVNLTFLITWLPRFISDLYVCYYDFSTVALYLQAVSYFTVSSCSWVNPIIYTLTSKMFRKNALKLLKCN